MKPEQKTHALTVYIPDTRGVRVSRFGKGNAKIGMEGVYTYSRLPGYSEQEALGTEEGDLLPGTCPGATAECQSICYARRPVEERGPVFGMWRANTLTERVPDVLPPDAKIVRIHVSGDFTSVEYIDGWRKLIHDHPEVRFFAYTRSWRVPELLVALENLRALPNLQLFASMDKSTEEMPPTGWRVAWIAGDYRLYVEESADCFGLMRRVDERVDRNHRALSGQGADHHSFTCPEQTGHKANCQECRYCIDGNRNDVTFLQH